MERIVVEGFVINETPYKESSKIINILTRELGGIGLLARGAKSVKSKLRVGTNKLDYSHFEISYKKDKLSTLLDVRIIDNFKNIKFDLEKTTYMYYLVDLIAQINKHEHNIDTFDILLSAIKKINDGFNPSIITNIVEVKMLKYLGVMPILDRCSKCGGKNDIITLSSKCGGLVCSNCKTNEYIVNINTIKIIRMLYYVDIDKITKLNISDIVIKQINKFIKEYYESYTGIYIKNKNFIDYIK